jgi:hypothetical protein
MIYYIVKKGKSSKIKKIIKQNFIQYNTKKVIKMAKIPKPGFLKISIHHGSIFQKERIERQWNCSPLCKRENPPPEPKKELEVKKELIASL